MSGESSLQTTGRKAWKNDVVIAPVLPYGLPCWLSGKELACQFRTHKFDPWSGKIPWRRKWQSTLVFLPGKAWWATVHGIVTSWTQLSDWTRTFCPIPGYLKLMSPMLMKMWWDVPSANMQVRLLAWFLMKEETRPHWFASWNYPGKKIPLSQEKKNP